MKGNEKLITVLNALLADELTAINRYLVHSEMSGNWGYGKLYQAIRKQATDDMFQAELLIERIISLEGNPIVSNLNPVNIGKNVSEMIKNNVDELDAVHNYNGDIQLNRKVQDQGTVELVSKILKMEEEHADWAKMQRANIQQIGLKNYLMNQIEASAN